jgi:uncharacterized membrane protein HdeD (DUF308 family)
MASEIIDSIKHWWVFLLRGLLFIAVGVYMISSPLKSYVALSFLFGLVIIVAGIAEAIHAYAHRYIAGQVLRFYIGVIDVLLGIILVANLTVSMVVLPIILGAWFLFRGVSLFTFAGLLRRPLWLVLSGIITIIFALLVIFNPVFGAMTIVLWTAFAFIVIGIFNGLLAFRLKTANDLIRPA